MPEKQSDGNIVWVACRVHGKGCGGRQAVIVSTRSHNPTPNQSPSGHRTIGGSFEAASGGKVIRYRCLSCGGTFLISQ